MTLPLHLGLAYGRLFLMLLVAKLHARREKRKP